MTFFIPLNGSDLTASLILDSMLVVMHPPSSQGKIEQEIISPGNVERVFTFDYYSENNGENVLICYTDPPEVKCNSFLIKNNGNDIWVFFPKTRRLRKLPDHVKNQRAHGSDFSYEDFSGSKNWIRDYNVKKEESGERETYLLKFSHKENTKTSYESQRIYVDKLNYYPHSIQYYQSGKHVKTLTFRNVIDLQGYPTAQTLIMKNHIDKSQTKMRILDMEYNLNFKDGFFNERILNR